MAAEGTKSDGVSADSYIGSFISLTSKSAIRYEGFLFHLNPTESTIGIRNVKSFGTEGRKKDGPQILPSEKVYDYIYFRGTDIKDLQVISSTPVQRTSAVPDDPAIIQSHYPQSTSTSTSLSSNAQSGPSISAFQGNLPPHDPVGNLGSWSSSAPPSTTNQNGLVMPIYRPGFSGSHGGISHLQQQMQYPGMTASLPDNAPKLPEFSLPLLPTSYHGSPNLPSTMSPLPSSLPIGLSTILASNLSPNPMPNNTSNAFSSVTLGSSLPMVLPLTTSSLDVNPTLPPIAEPKSVGPSFPSQNILQPMPSIVGSSTSAHSEAPTPPLVTPGQLLQPGSKTPSSAHSLLTDQKDIEVVQATASKSQEPAKQPPSPPAKKLNGGSLSSPHSSRYQAQERENMLNGTGSHTHRSNRGRLQGRGNTLNGAALYTHHNHRGHARGKGNGLDGAALNSHHINRRHSWSREKLPNGVAPHAHFSYSGHQRGRGAPAIPKMTKFTEDFDFEAMNEKFNKEEVWGQLGKSSKPILEDIRDKIDDGQEGETVSPKTDLKTVYVKDDFFDSFSCNTLNHESGKGRSKLSEQMKIDTETFGVFRRDRRGHGGQGPGRGGGLRGSYRGRGYGNAGRGRGGTVWSRIT